MERVEIVATAGGIAEQPRFRWQRAGVVFLVGQILVAGWVIYAARATPYAPPSFTGLDRADVTDPSQYLEFLVGAELLVIAVASIAGAIGARPWPYRAAVVVGAILLLLPGGCVVTFGSAYCPNQRFPIELLEPVPDGAAFVEAGDGGYTRQSYLFSVPPSGALDEVSMFSAHYSSHGWRAILEPNLTKLSGEVTGADASFYTNAPGGQWYLYIRAEDDTPGVVTLTIEIPNQSGLCG